MWSIDYNGRKTLRKMYENMMGQIIANYPHTDPYFIDWCACMTPIEYNVWSDIRFIGLPMYPEFPIGEYFVDFADPVKKIAIEVDSKEWHLNKEKDNERQKKIEKMGWKVFRIAGHQTYKQKEDYIDDKSEEELETNEKEFMLSKFYNESSEGILRRIKNEFYQ